MKREEHQILLIITHRLYNCGDILVWAYNMLLRKLGEIMYEIFTPRCLDFKPRELKTIQLYKFFLNFEIVSRVLIALRERHFVSLTKIYFITRMSLHLDLIAEHLLHEGIFSIA